MDARAIVIGILVAALVGALAIALRLGGSGPEVLTRPAEPAERIAYGPERSQFGELRLPAGPGPFPVAIVIHGGCWLAQFDLGYMSHLSKALAEAGVATWSIEFRRLGERGGGWPGTFQDVGAAADHLRDLAGERPLDLERVVAVGHSAGGQLGLWLAARGRMPADGPLAAADPIVPSGVVTLAAMSDLTRADTACGGQGMRLVAATGPEGARRLALTSPIALVPLGIPQRILHGDRDPLVPTSLSSDYVAAAERAGDDAQLVMIPGADHFTPVDPESPAWPAVRDAILDLVGAR